MKGHGVRNIVAENLFATHAKDDNSRWMYNQGLMCWKCQKDKPRKGGEEKIMGKGIQGLRKFICKECVEAKQRSIAACQDPSPQSP
jgi:hypothetical protein